jgi:hypothetical protein
MRKKQANDSLRSFLAAQVPSGWEKDSLALYLASDVKK